MWLMLCWSAVPRAISLSVWFSDLLTSEEAKSPLIKSKLRSFSNLPLVIFVAGQTGFFFPAVGGRSGEIAAAPSLEAVVQTLWTCYRPVFFENPQIRFKYFFIPEKFFKYILLLKITPLGRQSASSIGLMWDFKVGAVQAVFYFRQVQLP